MMTIALFGAAGKMGLRIAKALSTDPEYRMLCVEEGAAGEARLREAGLPATRKEQAVGQADVVILAVHDRLIAAVARDIVPSLKSAAMLIGLDAAAPYAGALPQREDISYFLTHPCHPPIFNDETDPEARVDYYGGVKAKQPIVCALMQGPEADYVKGETIARKMFAPVTTAHRITVEQMAILEPALSETVAATCLTVVREALDEAIRRGVPPAAAKDFLMGHLNVNVAALFDYVGMHFSDGALLAIERSKRALFRADWKEVFEPENILKEAKAIAQAG